MVRDMKKFIYNVSPAIMYYVSSTVHYMPVRFVGDTTLTYIVNYVIVIEVWLVPIFVNLN